LTRKCWEEMRDRWRKGKVIGRWEQERKEFYRERRIEEGEEERIGYDELERRERQIQRMDRKEKLQNITSGIRKLKKRECWNI